MKKIRGNPRLLLMSSALFFSLMAACVKAVSMTIPVYEAIFFRSVISTIILGWMLKHRGLAWRANNQPLLLLRGLTGLLALACNFYALSQLDFGDAALLLHTFPLWAAVLAVPLLGERPPRILLAWVVLAWIGVASILRPQLDILNNAGFIALLGGFFVAINAIVIRQSHTRDPTLRIAFYFTTISTIAMIPILLQHYVVPNHRELVLLIGAGLFGTAGQLTITKAYGLGDVSHLSPLAFIGVVASFILGVIFWQEMPTAWSMAGSAIVIFASVQIARIRKPAPIVNRM